ncbi:MAG: type I methionyl aminopeptidase [Candidatus Paceibacterota bacterium]
MIKPKTAAEIDALARGGARLAAILRQLANNCVAGRPVRELNDIAIDLIAPEDKAAFFNYRPAGASRPYPAHVCVSVNDAIVHGIPSESDHVLADGDLVTVDMGLLHDGLITDSARTLVVGELTEKKSALLQTCQQALEAGIAAAKVGGHVGDISAAIQAAVGDEYSIFRSLVGHGVGYSVHEDPLVPNFGHPGTGPELVEGTVVAIEPMIGLGTGDIITDPDGYTYRTADGSLSAHFEHTIAITAEGPRILSQE